MTKLKVGIIGLGGIARSHCDAIATLDNVEVVAVADLFEPPTHGEYGRHIMEIVFAAEQSAISGREVMLQRGHEWSHQSSGNPVTIHHGWI